MDSYRQRYENLREKYIQIKVTLGEIDILDVQDTKARASILERFVRLILPSNYRQERGFSDWKDISEP